MKSQERINTSPEAEKNPELEKENKDRMEALRNKLEKGAEQGPEESQESLSERAKEMAEKNAEKESANSAEKSTPERNKKITPSEKKQAFKHTMDEARQQMSGAEKAFSKVIHNPAIDAVSQAAGKTIARPNSILFGSVFALCFVVVIYVAAKYQGYPLSGSESILAFAAGWVFGILFDYARVLIMGRIS